MLNDIIDGISNRIYDIFGSDTAIYADEKVLQNVKTPCFFIEWKETSEIPFPANRFLLSMVFAIRYFPQQHFHLYELHEDMQRLSTALSTIETSYGLLRGKGLHLKSDKNGVVFISVTYQIFKNVSEAEGQTMNQLHVSHEEP